MFGLFTYVKIAIAAVVIGVLGNYIWDYHHMKSVIEQQQAQIDTLNSKQTVLDENQKATQGIVDQIAKARGRATSAKNTMQQVITEPSPDNFINFTRRYRVRPDDPANPSQNGAPTGHPKSKIRPPALPAPH